MYCGHLSYAFIFISNQHIFSWLHLISLLLNQDDFDIVLTHGHNVKSPTISFLNGHLVVFKSEVLGCIQNSSQFKCSDRLCYNIAELSSNFTHSLFLLADRISSRTWISNHIHLNIKDVIIHPHDCVYDNCSRVPNGVGEVNPCQYLSEHIL